MNNIFGSPYDLTTVTVDGHEYMITNEDYRWLMEKLQAVDKQYQPKHKHEWITGSDTAVCKLCGLHSKIGGTY